MAAMAVLALAAGIGLCVLFLDAGGGTDGENAPDAGAQAAQEEPALAQRADFLPSALRFGERLPVTEFKTKDGGVRSLDELRGKTLVLLFWGSWCPYCERVLERSAELERALRAYPDTELILIDKLDPDKGETVEKAQRCLAQNGVGFESLYDEGLRAYAAYGMKRIPTALVLDGNGYLRAMTAQPLTDGEALRALLEDARGGGATARFVREHMTGEDGGVYTTYAARGGDSPTGRDVLSESQGLAMVCALLADDREWFDQSYGYAKEKLEREGVFCWYAAADGKRAGANALIDDLRIYSALRAADGRWGGYGAEAKALATALGGHNVSRGHLCGFYDFAQKRVGNTVPLLTLDLSALRLLEEDAPGIAAAAREAEAILCGGYIGDDFPLYYASYDHKAKRYSHEDLNTSEALTVLLHAVTAGVARRESLDWLARRVASGTLAARYDVSGRPVPGYAYDSTAAYALAALIGARAGDAELYTGARNRMENLHVAAGSPLAGAFSGREDGEDIIAFDQLLPLLVYSATADVVFEE